MMILQHISHFFHSVTSASIVLEVEIPDMSVLYEIVSNSFFFHIYTFYYAPWGNHWIVLVLSGYVLKFDFLPLSCTGFQYRHCQVEFFKNRFLMDSLEVLRNLALCERPSFEFQMSAFQHFVFQYRHQMQFKILDDLTHTTLHQGDLTSQRLSLVPELFQYMKDRWSYLFIYI